MPPRSTCIVKLHNKQYATLQQRWEKANAALDALLNTPIPPYEVFMQSRDLEYKMALDARLRDLLEHAAVEAVARTEASARFSAPIQFVGGQARFRRIAQMTAAAQKIIENMTALTVAVLHPNDKDYMSRFVRFCNQQPPVVNADSTGCRASGPRMIMLRNALPLALQRVEAELGLPRSPILSLVDDAEETQEDDPIVQATLCAKKAFLRKYAVLLDETPLPKTTRSLSHDRQTDAAVRRLVLQQLFRHLVLWCPTIRPTAVRLGSISELFTSNVISIKGLNILEFAIEHDCFGNGLTWWKSAVLEAVHIVSAIPPKDPTLDVLGGWIYSDPDQLSLDADGWMILTDMVGNPPNLESKFTPLCKSFEDLHTFFSVLHLSLPPPPHIHDLSMGQARVAMCQAGFIMAELVGGGVLGLMPMILPTEKPGTRRGTIQWVEMQRRTFVEGVISATDTPWTRAFLDALRAQARACVVVVYDETKKGDADETIVFGGPPGESADWSMRSRTFDGPPFTSFDNVPKPSGTRWTTMHSAVDLLLSDGTMPDVPGVAPESPGSRQPADEKVLAGYVHRIQSGEQKLLFSNKLFPSRYVCVLDAQPGRDGTELLRTVQVAALRAAGVLQAPAPSDGDIAVAAADLHERRLKECSEKLEMS